MEQNPTKVGIETSGQYIDGILSKYRYLNEIFSKLDEPTQIHSKSVASICYLVSEKCSMNEELREVLIYSALFHDAGKIGIPDSILHLDVMNQDSLKLIRQKHMDGLRKILTNPEIPEVELTVARRALVIAATHHDVLPTTIDNIHENVYYPRSKYDDDISKYDREIQSDPDNIFMSLTLSLADKVSRFKSFHNGDKSFWTNFVTKMSVDDINDHVVFWPALFGVDQNSANRELQTLARMVYETGKELKLVD